MSKKIVYISILLGLLVLALFAYKNRRYVYHKLKPNKPSTIELNSDEPVLALFSFSNNIQNQIIGAFPHFKVILTDKGRWKINKKQIEEIPDSIPILITVETWNGNRNERDYLNPLEKLVNGRYDRAIQRLCTELIGERPNIFIRFDPEMEVPDKRFPWQLYGPRRYIDAFRYFAAQCKSHTPQSKIVWGPAGYPGTLEAYPGDDVVDVATVTAKSSSEISLDVYPKNYSTQYDVFRRLHRLRYIDKPVYILGSKQCLNDSVNTGLVNSITSIINEEHRVVYSDQNFKRNSFKRTVRNSGEFEIGLYDPQSLLNTDKNITVEHLFVDFSSLKNGEFEINFHKVIEREHDVIVTFEPFRLPEGKTDLEVLQNVTAGEYDIEIRQLYSILAQTDRRVYLRYAHEMEIPITRYPWQSKNPVDYIHSYRYFMTFLDPYPENIQRIWGPAGDRGSIEWYPGNDVVDFMSIAIYGLPDKNITDPEKQELFSTIFHRKFWRLRFINKPLFITEFGVKGPEDYQIKWLEDAAKVVRDNPDIVGVNYFNMSDTPGAWGEIEEPDWSISPKALHRFIEVLNEFPDE